jgi:hypothetical protein
MNINLEIDEESTLQLVAQTGLDLKGVFNEALALYSWAVESKVKGKAIASVDEKNQTYRTVEIPGLQNVQPNI